MKPRPLPERPNLGQLKKQAKSLLHAAHAHETEALRRFAVLPSFEAEMNPAGLALHDAQSVIAREHGFASWSALREEIEARALSFDSAVVEFVRLATGGASSRAERLLALHPGIASATLQTGLVLGDAAQVEKRLRDHRELATRSGGPQNWEPLLYACHTSLHETVPSRLGGLVEITRRLCSLGADPNAEYHWNWHPELPRTVLWAALCTVRHAPLAEVLLEAGANPTDGVSMHIVGSFGDVDSLELLHRYGADANGIRGGVPPLVYIMLWSRNPAGPYWLIEHGADPNLAWGEAGEAPLHVAARRWDLPMAEQLVRYGADLSRRRADGSTPHTLAETHGNREVAEWLLAQGARDELSPLERFVAVCARGDRRSAEAMLTARPGLSDELELEHHLLLQGAAESGNAAVLEAMLACGFDPRKKDKDGVTALHRAAMAGHVKAVRVLLKFGADIGALDGMFAATPLLWAVQGRGMPSSPGADHVGVARELIDARSPLQWTPPEGAPSPEHTLEGLIDLVRAAGGKAEFSTQLDQRQDLQ
ncbi:MAG TPA: ankyrin repeat domain-containing protein [Gammaproteobacteria bacterium]|nr:ankyrin repeat domain-containing protein [Gammaproteobacteria bacterium]